MDSERLARLFEAIPRQQLNIHSLLIVRNGYIVAEAYLDPFRQDTPHQLFSCTKGFISALVGIAIEKGYIDGVDYPVLDFFPGRAFANNDPRKEAMTLEHLLTMSSGLDWQEEPRLLSRMWQSEDWVQFVLDRRMAEEPGSQFNYCSGCSHLLSAIIQETVGMSTLDFARKHLFGPLGISDVYWELEADGIPIGGWGLKMRPRDMAKLGYLYLKGGVWDGQQLVPADWVRASVAKHVEARRELEYGYQWWRYPPLDAYMARGLGAQLIFVIPNLELVAVFTAAMPDDKPLHELIENFIVPAVRSSGPLPENPQGVARLNLRIKAVEKP